MSNINIATIMEFISNFLKYENTNPSESGVIYGGTLSGSRFDPLTFIRKPQVIFRLVALFFSILVFGCIASDDLYESGKCPFNEDEGACKFGIWIGVIAFLACLFFLVVDARFDAMSNVNTRRRAVIADLVFSGTWAFVWFICFCYLTNAWSKTSEEIKSKASRNLVQTSIAFSFFSILIWIALDLLSFLRYRQGASTLLSTGYEDHSQVDATGAYNPDIHDTYNQAPFNNNNMNNSGMGYQQPNY